MKSRLFWKILLSYWLTIFFMLVGLSALYVLTRTTPIDRAASRASTPVLSLLSYELRTGGLDAFDKAFLSLPRSSREVIFLEPATVGRSLSTERYLQVQQVVAPDGKIYRLVHRPMSFEIGAFKIPLPVFIVCAASGLIFSILLAAYITRPLGLLQSGFDQVAQGMLETRVATRVGRRRDEISDLATHFDQMAARLQQLVEARDRLLHDVSHELRSPLSRLQLAIGLARQDPRRTEHSLTRIEQEAVKLDALVCELLTLARAESGVEPGDQYFDPIIVLEGVMDDALYEAQASNIRFEYSPPALAEDARPNLKGNAALLRRAFENVIRNALRFGPPASTIEVTVRIDDDGRIYNVQVKDEGPGTPQDRLQSLFDPFVRADTKGFGLGLAIAKRAVISHGGNIIARNVSTGGFAVEINVPVAGAIVNS